MLGHAGSFAYEVLAGQALLHESAKRMSVKATSGHTWIPAERMMMLSNTSPRLAYNY